jgi:hypothetical protein
MDSLARQVRFAGSLQGCQQAAAVIASDVPANSTKLSLSLDHDHIEHTMSNETIFFQDDDILVTDARFVVGSQTYAMRGITSVRGIEITPDKAAPIFLIITGLLLLLVFVGIVFIGFGIYFLIKQKPKFAVVLTTSAGEVTAFVNRDSNLVGDVLEALNQAIVAHA